ncbi:MAG: DUF5384 family protein [Nitrosomonas sp.]|nr:DUF5384 family protein [Nitrosomonas sp.]
MCFLGINIAHAQTSLQDQIHAMKSIEQEAIAAQQARQVEIKIRQEETQRKEAQRFAEERILREKQHAEAQRQQRLAAEKAENLAKLEKQEVLNDKKRDQSFEDELRKLELEERKLELQRKSKRANREDDFIDQELNRGKAVTDVIQSEADATRNASEGARDLMKGVGQGAANKNKDWFK